MLILSNDLSKEEYNAILGKLFATTADCVVNIRRGTQSLNIMRMLIDKVKRLLIITDSSVLTQNLNDLLPSDSYRHEKVGQLDYYVSHCENFHDIMVIDLKTPITHGELFKMAKCIDSLDYSADETRKKLDHFERTVLSSSSTRRIYFVDDTKEIRGELAPDTVFLHVPISDNPNCRYLNFDPSDCSLNTPRQDSKQCPCCYKSGHDYVVCGTCANGVCLKCLINQAISDYSPNNSKCIFGCPLCRAKIRFGELLGLVKFNLPDQASLFRNSVVYFAVIGGVVSAATGKLVKHFSGYKVQGRADDLYLNRLFNMDGHKVVLIHIQTNMDDEPIAFCVRNDQMQLTIVNMSVLFDDDSCRFLHIVK